MSSEIWASRYHEMNEEWRTIEEFPDYKVSSYGRIRNSVSGNIRSPNSNGKGYLQTNFYKEGKRHRRAVHVLVARAFLVEPPLEASWVLHRDGNNQHNHAENLYYGSPLQNMEDCRRHGVRVGRPRGAQDDHNH